MTSWIYIVNPPVPALFTINCHPPFLPKRTHAGKSHFLMKISYEENLLWFQNCQSAQVIIIVNVL